MTVRIALSLSFVVAAGCAASGSTAVDAGMRDGGPLPPRDAGPNDAGDDASAMPDEDGGSADAGSRDAGADAGAATPTILIDGVVTDAEWSGATAVENRTASGWTGSEITRLRAWVDATDLYVAVEGSLATGDENTIVLYVDRELGSSEGVPNPIDLTDGVGALDDGLSAGFVTPPAFRVDFAWGTRDMNRAASGPDDRMGWRDVASNPADFAWVDSALAPTVCTANTACETRISLSTLGIVAPTGTIAMFARLTNADGTMFSNQTLPEDVPTDPQTVSVLLELRR